MPSVMGDESKQQVEEYVRSCNHGEGLMACLPLPSKAWRGYGSIQHNNACFRPKKDKSPDGVEVDGTQAYPPSYFNLAQM